MGKRLTGQWRAEGSWGSLGSGEVRSATIRRFPPGGTAHCYATI